MRKAMPLWYTRAETDAKMGNGEAVRAHRCMAALSRTLFNDFLVDCVCVRVYKDMCR